MNGFDMVFNLILMQLARHLVHIWRELMVLVGILLAVLEVKHIVWRWYWRRQSLRVHAVEFLIVQIVIIKLLVWLILMIV